MSHVILYKGTFVYNALNTFVTDLADGFKQNGIPATVIDAAASEQEVQNQLKRAFAQKPIGVIGLNCIGQFGLNNGSLYDELQVPFVQILMDDPMYHIKRLEQPIRHAVTTCVDPEHLGFIDDYFSRSKTASFLPHAGNLAKKPFRNERTIDVLFTGTGVNPQTILDQKKGAPGLIENLFKQTTDRMLTESPQHIYRVMEGVMAELHVVLPMESTLSMCQMCEQYIRAYRRLQILDALDKAEIAVDIYGNGWGFAQFKNHRVHGPVEFEESVNLITKAKTVLNVSPMFSKGTHDRVFSAMLNGALALTNKSAYFEERFVDNEDILFYDWGNLEGFTDRLKAALVDEDKLEAMAHQATVKAKKGHMWKHRAKDLLGLMQSCSVLMALN